MVNDGYHIRYNKIFFLVVSNNGIIMDNDG